jgi:hypothetical protein
MHLHRSIHISPAIVSVQQLAWKLGCLENEAKAGGSCGEEEREGKERRRNFIEAVGGL